MSTKKIDPELLLVWAQAARKGNLHEAADALFMSQPAVSQRLKQLQDRIGHTLYLRNHRGITPTPAGLSLLHIAEQVESALEAIKYLGDNEPGRLYGSLALIASHSNAETLIPKAVADFRKMHPDVSFRLTTTNSRQAKRNRNQADLIFVEDDKALGDTGGWIQETLIETDIRILVPEKHRWIAYGKAIPISWLSEEALIWREEGSGIREHVIDAISKHGVRPEIRYEFNGLAAIRNAVSCGLGVSFVSGLNGIDPKSGDCTLPIDPPIKHVLSVIYSGAKNHVALSFLSLLKSQLVNRGPDQILS